LADVSGDHPNGPRPAGDQCPGSGVASVAEFLDRGEHPVARGRKDVREVVEDARDRLMGDAGDAGHVGHPWWVADVATARSSRRGGGVDLGGILGLRHSRIVRPRERRVLSAKAGLDPFQHAFVGQTALNPKEPPISPASAGTRRRRRCCTSCAGR